MAKKYIKIEEIKGATSYKPKGTLGNHHLKLKWLDKDLVVIEGYQTNRQKPIKTMKIDLKKVDGIGYNSGNFWVVSKPKNELVKNLRYWRVSKDTVKYVDDPKGYIKEKYKKNGYDKYDEMSFLSGDLIMVVKDASYSHHVKNSGKIKFREIVVKKSACRKKQAEEFDRMRSNYFKYDENFIEQPYINSHTIDMIP